MKEPDERGLAERDARSVLREEAARVRIDAGAPVVQRLVQIEKDGQAL